MPQKTISYKAKPQWTQALSRTGRKKQHVAWWYGRHVHKSGHAENIGRGGLFEALWENYVYLGGQAFTLHSSFEMRLTVVLGYILGI